MRFTAVETYIISLNITDANGDSYTEIKGDYIIVEEKQSGGEIPSIGMPGYEKYLIIGISIPSIVMIKNNLKFKEKELLYFDCNSIFFNIFKIDYSLVKHIIKDKYTHI